MNCYVSQLRGHGSAPALHLPFRVCRREEAIRLKIEERRRLEKEKKRFAMRLEGSLAVERPPKVSVAICWLRQRCCVAACNAC